MNVGNPLIACGVGVAGPDVPGLQGFELLLRSQLVSL